MCGTRGVGLYNRANFGAYRRGLFLCRPAFAPATTRPRECVASVPLAAGCLAASAVRPSALAANSAASGTLWLRTPAKESPLVTWPRRARLQRDANDLLIVADDDVPMGIGRQDPVDRVQLAAPPPGVVGLINWVRLSLRVPWGESSAMINSPRSLLMKSGRPGG